MKPNKMIQAKAAIAIRLIPDRWLFLRAMKSALSSSTLAYRWAMGALHRLMMAVYGLLGTMSDILKQYLNDSSRTWDKYTSGYETLSAVLVYNDTRTYINLDSYVRKDEERAQKVLNGLIESLDKKNFNKNINADNPCIVLNYEKYNPDNGETVLADAIIQLDGYTRTEDYISDIDYY